MTVRYVQRGPVALVELDAVERRNALSIAALDALSDAIDAAAAAASRCLVLSSCGTVFSAGADFADLTGTSADVAYDDAVARVGASLRGAPFPVVAAVQGPCLGAAVDLVVSTDLVIATTSARFEVPAARLGILYNPRALAVMHARLGGALFRRLMLGLSVSAAEAASAGLVGQLVEPDQLAASVDSAVAQIVAAQPAAVRATKAVIAALDERRAVAGEWDDARRELLDSPERAAAIASRKRPSSPGNPGQAGT